jgi:hypothetical protein
MPTPATVWGGGSAGIPAAGGAGAASGQREPHWSGLVAGAGQGAGEDPGLRCAGSGELQGQVILAGETSPAHQISGASPDARRAIRGSRQSAWRSDRETVQVGTAYWHGEQHGVIVARGVQVLIPPQSRTRETPRLGWRDGRFDFMRTVLASDASAELYRHNVAGDPSRRSGRSRTTGGFDSSDEAAEPPRGRSGD